MNNHDLYDAYTALGINPTNDISAVKKAYRDMARRYHPDLHRGDKAYDDRCKIINIAYRKIIDALPRISHLSDSGKTSHFNDPGTNNDLDDLIASMSPDDRFHRCFADIPDADNGVARKYVLTSLYIGKDRGFMLVSNGLGLHADIAKAFFDDLHRRKVPVSNLDILGGGFLHIDWMGPNKNGHARLRIYGSSGDFGPPKSLLAVKTCLHSWMRDHWDPYTADMVDYDIS